MSSTYPEASDGGSWFRNAQFVSVTAALFDDDLIFSHTRIVTAIRPELSLSIPRFERDLHHADGSGRPEGKGKRATGGGRVADQRRDRACFNELEFRPAKNSKPIPH